MKDEMKDRLLSIIEEDEWDESELIDWAEEFLEGFYGFDRPNPAVEPVTDELDVLRAQVVPYTQSFFSPTLPFTPDGSLHGIGFLYDYDKDDRVLAAINGYKGCKYIYAMCESKGILSIYSDRPLFLGDMEVCGDVWGVREYVPYQGQWTLIDREFADSCVVQAIKLDRKKPKSWKSDPPTPKQIAYLKDLGYTGEIPTTKSEIGLLIDQYKTT